MAFGRTHRNAELFWGFGGFWSGEWVRVRSGPDWVVLGDGAGLVLEKVYGQSTGLGRHIEVFFSRLSFFM